MKFSSEHQPANKGRPKGSRNKRSVIPEQLHQDALKKLTEAVNEGESWAIQAILDRTMPKLKQTASGAEEELLKAQIELTKLKALEISELEQRLSTLEASLEVK